MTTPNLNQLPPISDFDNAYVLAQQAHEQGFRGSTFADLYVWLKSKLDLLGLSNTAGLPEEFPQDGEILAAADAGQWTILGPGTYHQPGYPSIEVAEGTVVFAQFDGTQFSIQREVEMPVPEGVDVIDPEGEALPKEKAVAEYVVSQNSILRNELLNFQFGGTIDWEAKPALTDGFFINRQGNLASTTPTAWAATEDFLPLYGAKQLEYFGSFGNSTTSLALYAEPNSASRLLVIPETDGIINNIVVDVPVGAQYYRASCSVPAKPNFKIVLKGVTSKVLNLQTFRMVGALTYENEAVKQSNIIWNDGSTGVITFGDWNEENLTFTSFVATSVQNEVTVTQPPVTFNSNNQITNYPNYIISSL